VPAGLKFGQNPQLCGKRDGGLASTNTEWAKGADCYQIRLKITATNRCDAGREPARFI